MEQICIAAALSCRAAQEQQQQGSAAWEVAQDGRDAKLDRGTVSILCFWIRFTFLAKMVWFSFRESAKLFGFSWPTTILHFSGSEMAVGLGNVRDHPEEEPVGVGDGGPTNPRGAGGSRGGSRGSNEPVYASIGETPALRSRAPSVDGGRPLRASPVEEEGSGQYPQSTTTSTVDPSDPDYQRPVIPRRPRPSHLRRQSSAASRRSRASVHEHKFFWALPHAVRKPLWAGDRVMSVLSPKWFRTTLLVWGACWSMSLAYTMFNAFLPKLLETRTTLEPELSSASPKRLEDSLWDVVIFTIGGCPGAIALWAVLYSWTQEIFATSALSRAIRNPLWAWPNRVELSQSWVTKDDSA
ncbi:hypothetical protein BKA70DRAFT_1488716, partial [Coprinopsis sp. MPI-PUGE-AT-0042]